MRILPFLPALACALPLAAQPVPLHTLETGMLEVEKRLNMPPAA